MESRGVVYIATGKKFVEEAILSANSVKKHMPEIPVSLFTDIEELELSRPKNVDSVFLLKEVSRSCRDKIRPLIDSPYSRTLFLDTDTYLCEPVYDLFEMLNQFDIALAHAPDRYQYDLPNLPDCFTELNSGVIVYRSTNEVKQLLHEWEITFNRMLEQDPGSYRDQHSLRDALYRSDLRFLVLPGEYNFRTICPNFAGRHCSVKIIHGRHANIEKVADRLNKTKLARVFLSSLYRIGTNEIGTYESFWEASQNAIFQSLPSSLKLWLSSLKTRLH
jgi:Nucleotide-diphospho-sugar transferase